MHSHSLCIEFESQFEFDLVSDFYVESKFEFEAGSDFLGVAPLFTFFFFSFFPYYEYFYFKRIKMSDKLNNFCDL